MNYVGTIAYTFAFDDKDKNLVHSFMTFANIEAYKEWIAGLTSSGSKRSILFHALFPFHDNNKDMSGDLWTPDVEYTTAICN